MSSLIERVTYFLTINDYNVNDDDSVNNPYVEPSISDYKSVFCAFTQVTYASIVLKYGANFFSSIDAKLIIKYLYSMIEHKR